MCKKLDYLNNYYVEVYDEHDNYITFLENIENAWTLFNKEPKKLLYAIRNNNFIVHNNKKYKLFLNKKELTKNEIKGEKRK